MVRRRLILLALVVATATGAAPPTLRPFRVATWLDAGVDPPLLPPAPRPSEPDVRQGGDSHPFRATAFPGEFDEPPAARVDSPPPVQRWGLTDDAGQRWESSDRAGLERFVANRDAQLRSTAAAPAGATCGPGGCLPPSRVRFGFR